MVYLPFCIKCGHEIPSGAAFCPNCGVPIEVGDTGEEILGLIERVNPWGIHKEWNLFFTSSRVIVARVGGGLGRAIFGVIGAAVSEHRAAERSEKLKGLSPEEILRAHEDNFAIPYSDIMAVKVKKPGSFKPVQFLPKLSKLEIITTLKNYKFVLFPRARDEKTAKVWWDNCLGLLRSVLGSKLTVH